MPGAEELVGAAGESCKVLDEAGAESLFESTRALSRQAIEGMKSGVIVPRSDRALSAVVSASARPAARVGEGTAHELPARDEAV